LVEIPDRIAVSVGYGRFQWTEVVVAIAVARSIATARSARFGEGLEACRIVKHLGLARLDQLAMGATSVAEPRRLTPS
jgi:hypothetical protein